MAKRSSEGEDDLQYVARGLARLTPEHRRRAIRAIVRAIDDTLLAALAPHPTRQPAKPAER